MRASLLNNAKSKVLNRFSNQKVKKMKATIKKDRVQNLLASFVALRKKTIDKLGMNLRSLFQVLYIFILIGLRKLEEILIYLRLLEIWHSICRINGIRCLNSKKNLMYKQQASLSKLIMMKRKRCWKLRKAKENNIRKGKRKKMASSFLNKTKNRLKIKDLKMKSIKAQFQVFLCFSNIIPKELPQNTMKIKEENSLSLLPNSGKVWVSHRKRFIGKYQGCKDKKEQHPINKARRRKLLKRGRKKMKLMNTGLRLIKSWMQKWKSKEQSIKRPYIRKGNRHKTKVSWIKLELIKSFKILKKFVIKDKSILKIMAIIYVGPINQQKYQKQSILLSLIQMTNQWRRKVN